MRPDLPCSIDNTVFYNTDFGNFEDCRFEFPEGKYRYGYRLCTASGIFPQTDAKKAHSRTDLVFSGLFFASAPHATAPAVLRIEWFLYKAGCSKVLRSPCGLTCVNCARFKGYPLPIRPIYMRDGLDPPLFRDSARRRRRRRQSPPQAEKYRGFCPPQAPPEARFRRRRGFFRFLILFLDSPCKTLHLAEDFSLTKFVG